MATHRFSERLLTIRTSRSFDSLSSVGSCLVRLIRSDRLEGAARWVGNERSCHYVYILFINFYEHMDMYVYLL